MAGLVPAVTSERHDGCSSTSNVLSIADHPALPIEIARAMRVYSPAGAVQLRLPTMASELIFAAAYPARVAIPIDSASVGHRNGQFGSSIFDRRKRRGFGRDWKQDHDADEQCKRENSFHSAFSRYPAVRSSSGALCSAEASLLEYSALREWRVARLSATESKANRRKLSARLGNTCER